LNKLKTVLSKPAVEGRPWAIWVWNLFITEDEALRQLDEFADKGFQGVAVLPGRDMIPEYLSEEFFNLFQKILDAAAEKNLGVKLYTDFSRPWDTGLESLLQKNAEHRLHYLSLESEEMVNGKGNYEKTIDDPENTIILAAKYRDGNTVLSDTRVLKVSASSGILSWKIPAGEWKVLVLRKSYYVEPTGGFTVNIFNARTAHLYIQNVLDVFKARFSTAMGKTFKGFVSEMPAIIPSQGAIPWDDDLVIKYRAKHKKELLKLLPSLFSEVDETYCKNRSHIYNFLLQSMFERFASTIETWTKKNHTAQWVLAAGRNNVPSPDMLKDFFTIPEDYVSAVGSQNAEGILNNYFLYRSLADMNVNEYRRETITVLGRNRLGIGATVQDLKNELDVSYLTGASHVMIDGCFFNLDQRSYLKTPFNPFWYSPDWEEMADLCDYAARLHEVFKDAQYAPSVAVLYPSQSVLADYLPDAENPVEKGINDNCAEVVDALRDSHLQFDIISEHLLLGCTIRQKGEFSTADRIRKGNYKTLVIPYANLISKSALVFIEKLASKGGTVIFVGDVPQGSLDEGVTKTFAERIKKLLGSKRGNIQAVTMEKLPQSLDAIESDVTINSNDKKCNNIHFSYGTIENNDVYFFRNDSDVQDNYVKISLPEKANQVYIDCATGEMYELEKVKTEEGICTAELFFGPLQSYIIVASDTKVPLSKEYKDKVNPVNTYNSESRSYRVVLKDQWVFNPLSPNLLPLAVWNNRIGLSRESGGYSHFYEATFTVKEVPEISYFILNGFSTFVKEYGGYEKAIELSVNGNSCEIDFGIKEEIPENEEPTEQEPFDTHGIFRNSLTANLSGMLTRGLNRITLRTIGYISDPISLNYPPVIVGNFAVKRDARGWVMSAPEQSFGYESWTRNGYPYFSGTGVYRHVFEVPSSHKRIILRFPKVSGSIAVAINGKDAGEYIWQPMEIDVTKLCETKRNELQVSVGNTIDNMLRMNGRASGLIGEVYLDVYTDD